MKKGVLASLIKQIGTIALVLSVALAVPVSAQRTRHPQLVAREAGSIEPARYEQLWEGGSIRV